MRLYTYNIGCVTLGFRSDRVGEGQYCGFSPSEQVSDANIFCELDPAFAVTPKYKVLPQFRRPSPV